MDKTFDQTLHGLLPALNGDLPPELIHLTRSLLSQSRAKASLKQDEEVARTYVCAHIACERLKQPLNLPQIMPRPPVPPRVYKKLHAFFDSALPSSSSSTRSSAPSATTPSRTRAANAPSTAPHSSPAQSRTPTRRRRHSPTVTPSKRAPAAHARVDVVDDALVPEWIMPAIRQLCKTFGEARAAPHIYAGMASVLRMKDVASSTAPTPTRTRNQSRVRCTAPSTTSATNTEVNTDTTTSHVPAILITVFLFTYVKMTATPLTATAFAEYRDRAIKVLAAMGKDAGRAQRDIADDVQACVREAREGWLGLEWFGNVPKGEDGGGEGEEGDEGVEIGVGGKGEEDEDEEEEEDMLQGGLGTMMNGRVNYLSQARKEDFVVWSRGIMARVRQLEEEEEEEEAEAEGVEDMDLDMDVDITT
ncbi:hypothetical protein EJ05DRAFT_507264 [Pseudovirgaria hyperparasitica]|uniref:ORC6 first cyclin-like domain-containing protein n=1 Tax=Pseudovirgaria hyperparasitica TaxID=470096 RepID=A0A6A6WFT8_9PEZI|nr:uncharacterized protein EJ05DRAFT_507264 [Pseudovirgaria hyperparasitica]KAF2761613.1 hypothetical protein EJ05DRAFT_507264 [Pseudovirgaria hyperparasitica]